MKFASGKYVQTAAGALRHLLLAALAVMLLAPASAHEVRPMRAVLPPGVFDTLITVTNTRDYTLPIEVVVQKRDVNPDGTQTLIPADDDFLVFPPQFLLEVGQSQAIRVEYIGDRALRESQAYIIDVQEVPVVPENFSGVVTVYNFGAALYLTAANARPQLQIENVRNEGSAVAFEVVNRGKDYGFLTQTGLSVLRGAEERRFGREALSELVENPIIPPNSARSFRVEHGLEGDGPLTVSFLSRQP